MYFSPVDPPLNSPLKDPLTLLLAAGLPVFLVTTLTVNMKIGVETVVVYGLALLEVNIMYEKYTDIGTAKWSDKICLTIQEMAILAVMIMAKVGDVVVYCRASQEHVFRVAISHSPLA